MKIAPGSDGTSSILLTDVKHVYSKGDVSTWDSMTLITCLLQAVERLDEDSKVFLGEGLMTLVHLLPIMKGCCIPACGLMDPKSRILQQNQ